MCIWNVLSFCSDQTVNGRLKGYGGFVLGINRNQTRVQCCRLIRLLCRRLCSTKRFMNNFDTKSLTFSDVSVKLSVASSDEVANVKHSTSLITFVIN